ncbi:hypothetical protein BD413DRAFT_602116 [Trametes elegans]|nr:hypothetical protein BD413DRAFT_602116 [Trametes elegans]
MESAQSNIKPLDRSSIHSITSGQVVVDLQTAVKELVENSLDAGATSIDVRFKHYGLDSFEVVDNGSGIAPADYDSIALKHHTSKLSSFADLEDVSTFGFRGEALSSLCALAESVSVTTATAEEAPVGTVIEFERTGKVKSRKGKAARQRGTTVLVSGLFKPLPVRRKELERNAKREFGKALTLLHAYALVPCANENKGVRLHVTNQLPGGKKTTQLRTEGAPSTRASVSAIWGPKALDNLVDLDLSFPVEVETAVLRRLGRTQDDVQANEVKVRGWISKFAVGCGRNGTDRQFFFVNGRPCVPAKVQKAFNEVYRSFNATQSPFIVADFILPANSCDVNVSPDKRTILLHSENNLVHALKTALEAAYAPARSTFDVNSTQAPRRADSGPRPSQAAPEPELEPEQEPLFLPDDLGDGALQTPSQGVSDALEPPGSSQGPSTSVEPLVPPDEESFGEPTLLSEPGFSSSAPRTSQGRDVVPVCAGPSDAEQTEGVSRTSEVTPETDTSGRARSTKRALHSPTITQMLKKRRASVASDTLDDDDDAHMSGDDDHAGAPPRPNQLAHLVRTPISRADSPPIPSLKPPPRSNARASTTSLPRSSTRASVRARTGDQMVLSTSGASWNLRHPGCASPGPSRRAGQADAGTGPGARQGMRALLRGFARTGSTVEDPGMEVDEDEDDEGREQDGVRDTDTDGDADVPELPGDAPASEPDDDGLEAREDSDVDMDVHMDEDQRPNTDAMQDDDDEEEIDARLRQDTLVGSSDVGTSSTSAVSTEIIRTGESDSVSLTFDLLRVTSSWKKLQAQLLSARREQQTRQSAGAGANEDAKADIAAADEDATEALSRVIDKADFASMDVVGQFNLGFIIVRRRKSRGAAGHDMDDLFIVDQHAADEKYNFETLQQTTKIDSQKLFYPQVLELTAADELIALENMDVLRQNGFELAVLEDQPPGQRVQLGAQPISRSTVFDTKDLEELLHLLQDRPAGQMVRCSKARAMFAMRACRKSIMIGTPLSRRQMTSVVQHMGTMDQPWHCPHGRPTMRHLSDIAGLGWDRRPVSARNVDWAAFGRAESEL